MDRAEALQKRLEGRQDAIYTNAVECEHGKGSAAVITREKGDPASCCSVRNLGATEAEEVAIALALTQKGVSVIVTYSKSAIRNFDAGRISAAAVRILSVGQPPTEHFSLIYRHRLTRDREGTRRRARRPEVSLSGIPALSRQLPQARNPYRPVTN